MPSNYFECCPYVNPMDSVPEALSNIIEYDKKQDVVIAKKANADDLAAVAKSGRYDELIDKPVALPNPKPITINGQRYDGREEVTVTVSGEGGGTPVEIDDTLTQSGKAADAKAVGDQLSALNQANAAQDTEIAKKANDADLAAVAKSGSYTDLTNKPTIPTVPTTLPNPNKLKLTGAVTAEYDGSAPVSVEIPSGGGSTYELPIASPTTLGGVMPAAKSDRMTQAVGVDESGGLWTMAGGSSGGSGAMLLTEMTLDEDVLQVDIPMESYYCNEFFEAYKIGIYIDLKVPAETESTKLGPLYVKYWCISPSGSEWAHATLLDGSAIVPTNSMSWQKNTHVFITMHKTTPTIGYSIATIGTNPTTVAYQRENALAGVTSPNVKYLRISTTEPNMLGAGSVISIYVWR